MTAEPLGITRLLALHYYVRDLDRSRRFYTERMDFAELGGGSERLRERGRQRSLVFAAGDCVVVCSTPKGRAGARTAT